MMHVTPDDLVLAYYGEIPATRRRVVREHLAACSACAAEYARLRDVLALVDTIPVEQPGDGFERQVWARLHPRVCARGAWWRRAGVMPVSWAAASALAAALVVAVLAGWLPRESVVDPKTPALEADAAAGLTERVLLIAIGEHLDRSQVVLTELMHAEATDVVLAGSRERVTDLVAANRLYRQTAAQVGDELMTGVLAGLERVLVEIANAPSDHAGAELAGLQERVQQGGMLFRVRVLSSEMRARELAEVERQRSTS